MTVYKLRHRQCGISIRLAADAEGAGYRRGVVPHYAPSMVAPFPGGNDRQAPMVEDDGSVVFVLGVDTLEGMRHVDAVGWGERQYPGDWAGWPAGSGFDVLGNLAIGGGTGLCHGAPRRVAGTCGHLLEVTSGLRSRAQDCHRHTP